ncbi:hypothetical protein E2I00_019305 [Balaenoptera physalus]|uniref:UBA domain-containing protein n=1 Tax=Balaenoptera physalus TaxID=9770 RepID=A0A643BXC8_BALPH|nr:hypothetical protein E2I00_019305 [Balaenoptera physalus]
MMTSVSSDRSRGAREKPQISVTQATQLQKQVVQATAEQMRLAQVIFDKNDSEFEAKVKQLMEVTGKNQDECIVALHDCNGDVNKAINILLEGNSDTTSWETVGGKKKNFGKESSENKENREKRSEREVSRGRGNNNRKLEVKRMELIAVKGTSLQTVARELVVEDLDVAEGEGQEDSQPKAWDSPSIDGYGTKPVVWEAAQNGADEGTELASNAQNVAQNLPNKNSFGLKGAWKNSVDEWTTEDWTEDLSETKVFTSSSVPAEHHVTPGQSVDLVALLQKPVPHSQASEVNSFETSQQQGFGQALVFTNSQHSNQMAQGTGISTAVNPYPPQSLSSVLGSGFGELAPSKVANITSSQILDQLEAPSLGQFTTTPSSQQNNTSPPTTASSWDLKPSASQSSVLSHFDFQSQPEPSPVLSQLSQRQQQQTQAVKLRESAPRDSSTSTVNKLLQLPSVTVENIAVSAHQPQPKHIKLPKRRIPPASKIPASAVEMPGSADVTGLNVQFGALEFGSEPSLSEFGSAASSENSSQIPISLYPKSLSDSLNTSLAVNSAVQNSTHTTSVITSSSLTSSSLSSTSPVTTSSSYDQSSVHDRSAYQSSNGHGGSRSQQTVDTPSSVPAPKTTDPPSALPSVGSLPSTTSCTPLLPSAPQHTAALPSLSQPGDLSSSPLSQLSSSLSGHQSSLSSAHTVLSTSTSHTIHVSWLLSCQHAGVESAPSLQSSATFSTAATCASSAASSGLSLPSSMNTVSSLCLGGTAVSAPSSSARATPLVTSGKAPPSLPQGAPPLLHSQYLVGPGGLLPAYPIYGYDELQMLQSRLPMDYYGIPFATPAALATRDGSLANNPYSAKQHGVSLSSPSTPFQQASGYGQHSYSTGYDDVSQGAAAGDYTKGGYGGSSQAQSKSAGSGPGKGVSASSSAPGLPDVTGSVYSKTQTFDRQGFHAGTPPPFSLPSALGSPGPLGPGYAPSPLVHVLPAHQQPHSQLLHHHLPQDAQTCNCVSRASVGSLPPRLPVVCNVFMYVFVNVVEGLGEGEQLLLSPLKPLPTVAEAAPFPPCAFRPSTEPPGGQGLEGLARGSLGTGVRYQ